MGYFKLEQMEDNQCLLIYWLQHFDLVLDMMRYWSLFLLDIPKWFVLTDHKSILHRTTPMHIYYLATNWWIEVRKQQG